MEKLIWETAEEIDMKLAGRIRGIRKRRSISQKKLSEMSGVSYGSIKRFETTGQISLLSLTKLAFALNEVDEIRNLFTDVPYRSIHLRNQKKQHLNMLMNGWRTVFLSALFHFHWKNGFLFPQKIIFEVYSACLQTACRMRGDSYC